ncbi:unnamed protein product [Discosporangium mesarthrocarpum]
MPTLDISGTEVEFPFDPYHCQVTYMRSVMRALDLPTNALLESPTGTGKTLCLLCSTLAWQLKQAVAARVAPLKCITGGSLTPTSTLTQPRGHTLQYEDPGQAPPKLAGTKVSVPTIIYASRTHSQLAQVVKELKNTAYRPKLSLLGSREQLCVNEEVRQIKGQAMNHACSSLVGARRCKYHWGTESGAAGGVEDGNQVQCSTPLSTVVDIEELISLAKKHQFCPYYLSRGEATQADLVLMPYNYLLDPTSRRGVKARINWPNSVVIFDEAHNLESTASDVASFEITSGQIAAAQEEAQSCYNILSGSGEGGGRASDLGAGGPEQVGVLGLSGEG